MRRLFRTMAVAALLAVGNFAAVGQESNDEEYVFTAVEQMPQFPGGELALMEYIKDNIQFPENGGDRYGRVVVKFVIMEDGSVGHAEVVRSRGEAFDNEAIRVIKSLPKFQPGKRNGKPVKVWYTMPVNFKPQ